MKLSAVTTKITDGTHYTPTYVESGVVFLSVKDVREEALSFHNTKFITQDQHKSFTSRCKPEVGDVLLTKIGTIGLAAVIPVGVPEFSIFVSVCLLKPEVGVVLPNYLSSFLNSTLASFQFKRQLKGVGVPDLHLENIRAIRIPLPTLDIQKHISGEAEKIFARKRQQEAQAQALLDSIDGYLLSELGIALPPEPENTIENRMFNTSWRQVSGGRFDPISMSKERVNALNAVQSGTYAPSRLHNVAHFPKIICTDNLNTLSYVGLENIESNTGFYRETNEKESFGSALNFKKGQVLFPKLRPYLNKVYYADFEGLCSTEFVILDGIDSLDNEFLSEFLRSQAVVSQTKYLASGNTLPRLQTEDTRRILVPIPPIDLQERVVETINDTRQQAQQLRQQAQREFAEAKQEIERLILG